MRTSLHQRGYLQGGTVFPGEDAEILLRLSQGMRMLKRRGLAPTFIYVFDEAWLVIERYWRALSAVLHTEDCEQADVVLEPSFFAHALERPGEPTCSCDSKPSTEVARHTTLGGNFGLPRERS